MSAPPLNLKDLPGIWERFFFNPVDPRICAIIRLAYAGLLLISALVLMPDLETFLGEEGMLPFEASRTIIGEENWTLFAWLPQTNAVLWTCFFVFFVQILCLLMGFRPRFQAACIFIWLISLHHRNINIWYGEDTIFRVFAFLMIWMPLGEAYSLDRRLARRKAKEPPTDSPNVVAWALRLMQLQMCVIYLSSALQKIRGTDWIKGHALYYVSRLDNLFGRFPVPNFLFEYMPLMQLMGWGVLFLEFALPFALWFRELRRPALVLAILFHLSLDYTMNLFLFQWIMMVGLLSFLQPEDLADLRDRWKKFRTKSPDQASTGTA